MISLSSLLSVIKDHEVLEIKLGLGRAKDLMELKNAYPITSELKAAYNAANYTISDLTENWEQRRTECIVKFKF